MDRRQQTGNKERGRVTAARCTIPPAALILVPAFFYALLCLYGFARLLVLS